MSFRLYPFFLLIYQDLVTFERTPENFHLNFGWKGGVGVNKKFTNNFSDSENPFNDGYKK